MNTQWISKATLVIGLLFGAACSYPAEEIRLTPKQQGLSECASDSTHEVRVCITAVSNAKWVDAYTLGQLR